MMRTFDVVRIFAIKDLRIALTYRVSFVLGLFTTFFGMLSFFFVSRVVGHSAKVGSPADYFRFIVVGVTLSNVLRAAVVTAASNARSDQVEGTLEILSTQPISPVAFALGWSALPVLEALFEGVLMMAVAVPLGFSGFAPDWISVALVLIVSMMLFLAVGFMGAAFVLAIQQGTGIMSLCVGVMALAGGSLFPVSVLPGAAGFLTTISPLTYSLRAMRGAMLHDLSPGHLIGTSLGVMLIYTAIAIPISVIGLGMSFRFARSRGSLSRF